MYSKDNLQRRRNDRFSRNNYLAMAFMWVLALGGHLHGAALMEEGFNYPAGTALVANAPWTGTASSAISIAAGSLSVTNLRSILPGGNQLQLNGVHVGAGPGRAPARCGVDGRRIQLS